MVLCRLTVGQLLAESQNAGLGSFAAAVDAAAAYTGATILRAHHQAHLATSAIATHPTAGIITK